MLPPRRLLGAGATAIALCACLTPVAHARRAATAAEARKIMPVGAAGERFYISTVNRVYASVEFDVRKLDDPVCQTLASNGQDYYRRSASGRWRQITGMSDCSKRLQGVPPRAYHDLSRRYCHGRWQ